MRRSEANIVTTFVCILCDYTGFLVSILQYSTKDIHIWIRICCPGASSLALQNYNDLNIKQIQCDTLSHFLLARATTFSLSAIGDLTWSNACVEASQIYITNATETAEYIVKAFQQEKYSQVWSHVVTPITRAYFYGCRCRSSLRSKTNWIIRWNVILSNWSMCACVFLMKVFHRRSSTLNWLSWSSYSTGVRKIFY